MVDYCTSSEVSSFLQRSDFTNSTTPNISAVENIIRGNEDFINSYTGHSWKSVTISEEYIDPKVQEHSLGLRFDLSHRKVFTFSSGTDKFEVWNGTTWYDYVANKTESRSGDFFVDYTNGVVWLRNPTTIYKHGARFTYRYGNESSINNAINKACILLTCSDILTMLDKNATFSEDGASNRPTHDQRINIWREEAYRILDSFKEIRTL